MLNKMINLKFHLNQFIMCFCSNKNDAVLGDKVSDSTKPNRQHK